MPWWAQWLIGGGLLALGAFVTKVTPQLLAFVTGKAAIDKANRESLAAQLVADRAQFESERRAEREMELARIKDLVAQLNEAQARVLVQARETATILLSKTEEAASAKAELAAFKAGFAAQMSRQSEQLADITHNTNGAKAALEQHVATLLAELKNVKESNMQLAGQVNRAEEATAKNIGDQNKRQP